MHDGVYLITIVLQYLSGTELYEKDRVRKKEIIEMKRILFKSFVNGIRARLYQGVITE